MLGRMLDGKYELLAPLGSGGFAQVYEARHRPLECKVAVKILQEQWRTNLWCIEKLMQEAKLTSRIDHPNAVRVLDFERCGSIHYIVMELVRGRSLRRQLGDGPIALGRAMRWFHQILAGLHGAHRAGVVHGDLKPSNVLLETSTRGDRVKLIDFGPTPPQSVNSPADTVCGTPQYMAPELAFGDPASVSSDIYAAGVVLFELLTGTVPYNGPTAFETMKQHIERPVPDACEHGAPGELAAVARRAMAKSPGERYAAVEQMHIALMAACCQLGEGKEAWPEHTGHFAEGSEQIAEPTNAFGLGSLERAIARAVRSGRVHDLPRLYDRRGDLLGLSGEIAQAIAELEEGLCLLGSDREGDPPSELWRVSYRLALLYRASGALAVAAQYGHIALTQAAASGDQLGLDAAQKLIRDLPQRTLENFAQL